MCHALPQKATLTGLPGFFQQRPTTLPFLAGQPGVSAPGEAQGQDEHFKAEHVRITKGARLMPGPFDSFLFLSQGVAFGHRVRTACAPLSSLPLTGEP